MEVGDKLIRVECGFEYKIIDIYTIDYTGNVYRDGPHDRSVALLCNDGEIFSLDYDHVQLCLLTGVLKEAETITPKKRLQRHHI